MAQTELIDCVAFCRAMGDETRQDILRLLRQKGEMRVGDIVKAFQKSSQPTISHHLKILKQERLVNNRREGKEIFYTLNEENVAECCGQLFVRFVPARALKTYRAKR
jgi:ArsR family transcriptional regulator, arsenate/arsenite/antimonite-responsive transcriptional repressor